MPYMAVWLVCFEGLASVWDHQHQPSRNLLSSPRLPWKLSGMFVRASQICKIVVLAQTSGASLYLVASALVCLNICSGLRVPTEHLLVCSSCRTNLRHDPCLSSRPFQVCLFSFFLCPVRLSLHTISLTFLSRLQVSMRMCDHVATKRHLLTYPIEACNLVV